jgi:hypothetical protein
MRWAAEPDDPRWLADELLAQLRRVDAESPLAEQTAAAERFLQVLLPFGLALERDPALRDDPAIGAFLAESAALLPALSVGLQVVTARFPAKLGERFEWGDEWIMACERRSAVEFLFTLYPGAERDGVLDGIERDVLDEAMRERGRDEGGLASEQVPPGTPPGHWWWWWPRQPPG